MTPKSLRSLLASLVMFLLLAGSALAGFCTKCGQELPADARFCPKCGEKVKSADSGAPKAVPAPGGDQVVELLFEKAEKLRLEKNPFKKTRSYREARKIYEKIIKDHPGSVRTEQSYYQVANIYESIYIREWGKAVAAYKKMLELYPQTRTDATFRLAEIYRTCIEDRDKAIKWYRIAAKTCFDEDAKTRARKQLEEWNVPLEDGNVAVPVMPGTGSGVAETTPGARKIPWISSISKPARIPGELYQVPVNKLDFLVHPPLKWSVQNYTNTSMMLTPDSGHERMGCAVSGASAGMLDNAMATLKSEMKKTYGNFTVLKEGALSHYAYGGGGRQMIVDFEKSRVKCTGWVVLMHDPVTRKHAKFTFVCLREDFNLKVPLARFTLSTFKPRVRK